MAKKPTYEELEQRIKTLEEEASERRQVEEALRESEEKLNDALKMGKMGIWEFDLDSRETTWSDQTYELFDRDPRQGPPHTVEDISQYYLDDWEKMQAEVYRAIEAGESFKMDYNARLSSGKTAYHCSTIHPVKGQNGRVIKIRGTLQDISERKHVEERLKRGLEYFQLHSSLANTLIKIPSSEFGKTIEDFLEHIVEFFDFDRGTLIYWPEGDPASREIYSWNKEGIKPYSPPADFERYFYLAELLRKGEIFSFSNIADLPSEAQVEKDFFLNDGIKSAIRIPMNIGGKILGVLMFDSYHKRKTWHNALVQQLQLIAQTFTYSLERKHFEEVLQESEDKLRAIFENVNDGIIYLDAQGTVLDMNKKLDGIFGYKPEDVLEKHFSEVEFIQPDRLENLMTLVIEAHSGNLRQLTELEVIRKDGTEVLVEASTSVIEKDGEVKNIITIIRDITERKKLEAQLQQTHKMEAIGRLASGIAHDFNNILSAVIGHTEVALHDAEKGTPAYLSLREVLRAGNRAKKLVHQILTFSRQSEKDSKPLQVKHIVNEVLKMLRASLPATIEIRQNIKSNSLIEGDSTQIHQVLMNLCTNAAHSMKDKGGLLTVSLEDVQLGFEFKASNPEIGPGTYTRLTVRDTGHGMESKIIDRIFDPYFTTKEIGEGSGMGLAVVHGIVKDHCGHIAVYSRPNQGTTFHVFLPVIKGEIEPEIEFDEPLPTGTERILFIDDEEALVYTAKRTLERFGYEVVAKESPTEALEIFRKQPDKFDIVITDMTMPKMTGDDLAQKLIEIRPDIPVILCTGFSERISEKRANEMGIRAFVIKPTVVRDLAKTARSVLDEIKS